MMNVFNLLKRKNEITFQKNEYKEETFIKFVFEYQSFYFLNNINYCIRILFFYLLSYFFFLFLKY